MSKIYIYILIMAIVTYLIRVLPLTLIRKEIKNNTIKSFLYYVPYVTLSLMTQSIWSGAAALIIGIILAWNKKSLFQVAVSCCAAVFIVELIMTFL